MSTSAVTLPTVLVIAQPDDDAADLVVAALEDRDAPVTRFDTGDFPMSVTLAARPADIVHPGWLMVQGRRVDLGAVRSVYRRHPAAFGFPDEMSRPELKFAAMESMFGRGGVLAAQPWRWLDRPSAVVDAAYKPRQMRVAAACGLRVPRSLVTNDAEQVRAFAAEVGGPDRLVYKAMHAGPIAEQGEVSLIYTAPLEGSDLDRMDREGGVRMCPHLFQEWVDKTHDVRLIARRRGAMFRRRHPRPYRTGTHRLAPRLRRSDLHPLRHTADRARRRHPLPERVRVVVRRVRLLRRHGGPLVVARVQPLRPLGLARRPRRAADRRRDCRRAVGHDMTTAT